MEQAKKVQKRQNNLVKKKIESKDVNNHDRQASLKDQLEKQAIYRKEAARLRHEEQQELRE